jgi:hypothetical protein
MLARTNYPTGMLELNVWLAEVIQCHSLVKKAPQVIIRWPHKLLALLGINASFEFRAL